MKLVFDWEIKRKYIKKLPSKFDNNMNNHINYKYGW